MAGFLNMQLEIEREALRKEKDAASRDRLARLDKELADLKEEQTRLAAHWQQEKDLIQQSAKLQEQLEAVKLDVERAQRSGDYQKASELQYGRVPELEKEIKTAEARLAEMQKSGRMLKQEVDEEDIAEVVSRWTHIPVSRLMSRRRRQSRRRRGPRIRRGPCRSYTLRCRGSPGRGATPRGRRR